MGARHFEPGDRSAVERGAPRQPQASTRLVTLAFVTPETDRWAVVPADAPRAPGAGQLFDWTQWLDVRDHWPQEVRVGVVFPNHLPIGDVLPDLPRLALVALHFPKWTDGRAYSQARLLRTRHRFGGELRAIGDVIPDMAAQLSRTGFDSVQLRAGESVAVARRMLALIPGFYQADVHEPRLRFARQPRS